MMDEPTYATATFAEWYRALCEVARRNGDSAATEAAWMRKLYNRFYTPSQAWEAFINDEV